MVVVFVMRMRTRSPLEIASGSCPPIRPIVEHQYGFDIDIA